MPPRTACRSLAFVAPLAAAAVALAGCAPTPEDVADVPSAAAAAAPNAGDGGARTFERRFRAADLPKDVQDRLRKEHGPDALARIDATLGKKPYVPSDAFDAPRPERAEATGGSHQADAAAIREAFARSNTPDAVLVCARLPCLTFADIDGDGKRDAIAQVTNPRTFAPGVAVVLSSKGVHVLGAGRDGPLGADCLWVDGVDVLPRAKVDGAVGEGVAFRGAGRFVVLGVDARGLHAFPQR